MLVRGSRSGWRSFLPFLLLHRLFDIIKDGCIDFGVSTADFWVWGNIQHIGMKISQANIGE